MLPVKLGKMAMCAESADCKAVRVVRLSALGLLLGVFAVRLPQVGSLVAWDDAMILCAVRALLAGQQDSFLHWFWRHPPLFSLALGLAEPFRDGYVERAQVVAVMTQCAGAAVLLLLNRSLYGVRVALLSVALYAALPGAVFFGTWLKGDHGAVLFGLLALLYSLRGAGWRSGLALAAAAMCKETAVVFGLPVLVVILAGLRSRGELGRALLPVAVPSAAAMVAWYGGLWLAFGREGGVGGLTEYVHFAAGSQAIWHRGTFFYLQQLLLQLGWVPAWLAALGTGVICRDVFFERLRRGRAAAALLSGSLWPVYLILPPLIGLSLLPAKVPWMTIVFLPAIATLAALGLDRLASGALHFFPKIPGVALPVLACLLLGWQVCGLDYDGFFRAMDEGGWRGADRSYRNALHVNGVIEPDGRLLFTSFHYWKGIPPGVPCAVFTLYLRHDIHVLLRRHDATAEALWEDIDRFNIGWALLSPEPGEAEHRLFSGMLARDGTHWRLLNAAALFRIPPEAQPERAEKPGA